MYVIGPSQFNALLLY